MIVLALAAAAAAAVSGIYYKSTLHDFLYKESYEKYAQRIRIIALAVLFYLAYKNKR